MENEKKMFIVGIGKSVGNSVADRSVIVQRFMGTWTEVEKFLMALIEGDRVEDSESFDYGTKSVKELAHWLDGSINGYNIFSGYHIDYMAIPEEDLEVKSL